MKQIILVKICSKIVRTSKVFILIIHMIAKIIWKILSVDAPLLSVNFNKIKTSDVKTMKRLFNNCSSLKSIYHILYKITKFINLKLINILK